MLSKLNELKKFDKLFFAVGVVFIVVIIFGALAILVWSLFTPQINTNWSFVVFGTMLLSTTAIAEVLDKRNNRSERNASIYTATIMSIGLVSITESPLLISFFMATALCCGIFGIRDLISRCTRS